LGDQIKQNETGGACSTYVGEEHTGFLYGILREREHLQDRGIDGKIILKWIFRKWDERHDLAQDKNRWWALVNAVINLRVP